MSAQDIPDGFKLYPKDNSFNDAFSPLYVRMTDAGPQFGLRVEKNHCNPIGICHGAVLMGLMDIALSGSVCFAMGKYTGTPTISITLDYIAASREGDWIFAEVHAADLTRTMGFVNGIIKGSNGNLVRASGCFKLPNDIEAAPGISVKDFNEMRARGGF